MVSLRRIWFVPVLALIVGVGCSSSPSKPAAKSGPAITIGSANFSESKTLAEIYAGAIEAKGYTVKRNLGIGAREIYEPALERGEINFIPEYVGTTLEFLNKGAGQATSDGDKNNQLLAAAFAPKNIVVLKNAPGQDQNGFAVTKDTASKLNLKNTSDLAPVGGQLLLGGPPECPTRPFCGMGLHDKYGITFKDFVPLDAGGPKVIAALENNAIQVGLIFTSSGVLATKPFVELVDDKGLQPADNIVPVVSKSVTDAYGADFTNLVNSVSAKLTTDELVKLNKRTDVDNVDSGVASKDWLKANGFTA